jgi:GntR family transcriptional regulator/MocR family aminotransferase
LQAEGYVVSRRGRHIRRENRAGYFFYWQHRRKQQRLDGNPFVAPRATAAQPRQRQPAPVGSVYPWRTGRQCFPHPLFSKIQARISRRPKPERLSYSCNGGTPELQQALVDYLRVSRGVHCQADQILITEGIHQAIDLVTRMLCDSGDLAWVEEPSYWGIRHVLAMNDVRVNPITVDANGLCPPETVEAAPQLIFVTPSHQYPLGAVMSLERRQRLLALARQHGSWIVEDDYDSEFRFSGQPIPALQGLIADAPVVYIGTFSKTLYPGLRLGYVVLPRPLIGDLKSAHAELYRGGHSLIQMALAEFINAGHYSAHIRRMRLLYSRRRACLTELIQRYCARRRCQISAITPVCI